MVTVIFLFLILTLSLFLLVKASDYFIDSAEKFGVYLGLSSFILGVLIVSVGTSLPELISSIFSVIKGSSEIVLGNIIGSNIANIFLVFGIVAIFAKEIKLDYDILSIDLPLFVASAFLIGFMVIDFHISIFETMLCLLFLVVYIVYTIKNKTISKDKELKKETKSIIRDNKKINFTRTILSFIASLLLIFVCAELVVESVISLSKILNVGAEIISLSVVAIGTSLPELAVSLSAIKKKNVELAVGNILGSTIFNCVGVLGISSLFGTIIITETILMYALPLMLSGVLLYFFITQDKKVTSIEGWILLIFYILFLGYLFGIL